MFFQADFFSVGFLHGDMRRILDDISILKPTIIAVVPRVINGLYDKVEQLSSILFLQLSIF